MRKIQQTSACLLVFTAQHKTEMNIYISQKHILKTENMEKVLYPLYQRLGPMVRRTSLLFPDEVNRGRPCFFWFHISYSAPRSNVVVCRLWYLVRPIFEPQSGGIRPRIHIPNPYYLWLRGVSACVIEFTPNRVRFGVFLILSFLAVCFVISFL